MVKDLIPRIFFHLFFLLAKATVLNVHGRDQRVQSEIGRSNPPTNCQTTMRFLKWITYNLVLVR